jgi:hypothetical protein
MKGKKFQVPTLNHANFEFSKIKVKIFEFVTVKNSKSFATVRNFTQKMKALSDMSRLGGICEWVGKQGADQSPTKSSCT